MRYRVRNRVCGGLACSVLSLAVMTAISAMPAEAGAQTAQAAAELRSYEIPAGGLREALNAFGAQSGLQVIYRPELVKGKTAVAVAGRYTWSQALQKLLEGSDLQSELVDGKSIVLKPAASAGRGSEAKSRRSMQAASVADDNVVGMPAIMVKGAKTLNIDIERTVDDPLPYVVFDRAQIEQSGAVNLDDFMRTKVPMNARTMNQSQWNYNEGSISSVDLRGLGVGQTLILIDGRRAAGSTDGITSGQADINGIPMAAIERIEILPATASAIYGGSATGGVINVILRRDYVGNQVAVTYDNSFDTDSAIKRIDLSTGFSLLGGRTRVLLNGSYSEGNSLLVRDRERDFTQRHFQTLAANNPALYAQTLPLGAGANIKSTSGEELVLKSGQALGSTFTSAPSGYAGAGSDAAAALVANAGTYNTTPHPAALLGSGGGFALAAPPLVKYLSGSISHEFNDRIKGFFEASRSENSSVQDVASGAYISNLPSSLPTNPFQQSITVYTAAPQLSGSIRNDSTYSRASAGLVVSLPAGWAAAADYTFTVAERSYAYAWPYTGSLITSAARAGAIDPIADLGTQDLSAYILSPVQDARSPTKVEMRSPAVRLSGPVASLKSGKVQLSLLLERQDSEYSPTSEYLNGGNLWRSYAGRSRTIDSAYAELQIPVVSAMSEVPWLDELQFQVAGRWDSYETHNAWFVAYPAGSNPPPFEYVKNTISEFSPLVAMRLRPNQSLMLRASYSEGFLPPDIDLLTAPIFTYGSTIVFSDPRRGGTGPVQPVDLTDGGNPDLGPEYSTTRSVGLVYTPEWLPDFRVSVDYIKLEKEGNIAYLTTQGLLNNEQYFPERVVRGEKLPGDPADWAGPIVAIDRTTINAARGWMEAYDVQVDYTFHTVGHGSVNLFGVASLQTRYEQQLLPSSPAQDMMEWGNMGAVPVKLKGNLGGTWNSDPWTVGWTARYASSYYVDDPSSEWSADSFLAQGNGGRVPSQIYHDVFAKYKFGGRDSSSEASRGFLDGLEIQLGIRNLFNKVPPYDYSMSYPPQYYSTIGDPRLATYYLTVRSNF